MTPELPVLTTDRLELRPPTGADFAPMLAIVSDEETGRYLGRGDAGAVEHFMRFARSAGSWLLYGYGMFIMRPRGSETVIGNCGMFHTIRGLGEDFDNRPEAGWILHRDYAGQGLAQEAMEAALAWFDATHGPRRIVCMIDTDNAPSLRLAEKLGFTPMREAGLGGSAEVLLLDRAVTT